MVYNRILRLELLIEFLYRLFAGLLCKIKVVSDKELIVDSNLGMCINMK
jgi:hypothetical protein